MFRCSLSSVQKIHLNSNQIRNGPEQPDDLKKIYKTAYLKNSNRQKLAQIMKNSYNQSNLQVATEGNDPQSFIENLTNKVLEHKTSSKSQKRNISMSMHHRVHPQNINIHKHNQTDLAQQGYFNNKQ